MDKKLDHFVATLESVLQQQIGLHHELLSLVSAKREALASGRPERLANSLRLENQKVQAVGELEKRRLEAVAALTLLIRPNATEPMRLDELANHLPAPAAARVLAMRAQLRQNMEEVRRQTTIARRATESLMRHVQGLIQTIAGEQTYAPGGRVLQRAVGVSTFNLTA